MQRACVCVHEAADQRGWDRDRERSRRDYLLSRGWHRGR
jgi:hypothetical protein